MIGKGASLGQAAGVHAPRRHGGRCPPGLPSRACRKGCRERRLAGSAFRWQATTSATIAMTAKHPPLGRKLRLLLCLGSRGGGHHHRRGLPCRRRRCGGRRHWLPLWLGCHRRCWRSPGHRRRDGITAAWAWPRDPCHVSRHGQSRATVAALKLDRFRGHPMDNL